MIKDDVTDTSVTLKEVARLAGVAPITVSRVINHQNSVKEETREKVKKAMAELKYIPNVAARNLITRKSRIIDIYIPENIELTDPFMMQFIAGASEALSRHMYSFLILRSRKTEHICDGYIVTGILRNEIFEFYEYAKERKRSIALFGHTDIVDVDCIDVDNISGAKSGVGYLIQRGHRSIAMLNIAEDKDYVRDRQEGYRQAMEESGCGYDPSNVFFCTNQVQSGYETAREILKKNRYTAFFCATDTIAVGVENAIAECGLRVPEDISVMGYDGLGHHLLGTPRLTTVKQPVYEIGVMLAQTLINRLEKQEGRTCRLLQTELLMGRSVKKAE
ncbi:MAG: LacI family transcriptional regulator [Butyrivibrio sp.]|jgi:LacI family transcriptional regulator|nr:LacI family transcriptional regulator [Butyrivibrio sp.]